VCSNARTARCSRRDAAATSHGLRGRATLADSAAAGSDTDTAVRLLDHLRRASSAPALGYAEAPSRVSGGFETDIFRLTLAGAPATLAGPLILRILRPHQNPRQIRLEAAVQNALVAQGYPAPRAALVETDASVLGGAFMLMERLPGRPLAQGFDVAVSGGAAGRVLRLLAEAPRTLERIAARWGEMHARLHALPVEPIAAAFEAAGVPVSAISFEGRLASLAAEIERLDLARLRPVLAWLAAHQPGTPERLVLCHGDFHPLNILAEDGRVRGVLDWGNAAIGDAAFDVGSTIVNLTTVPIGVPAPLRPAMRGLIAYALRRYLQAYRRIVPIDEPVMRYYQVARCAMHLAGAAQHEISGGAAAGAHHSPTARVNLAACVHRITGIRIAA
jgi:aminoglycoside phosphotransferase (APT) family kinase protein